MAAGDAARRVARGVGAGFVATAAMTATTALERGALGAHHPVDYDDSPVLVEQLERWTGASLDGRVAVAVNQAGRFSYGSAAGVLRAALDGRTRHPVPALVALLWGAEVAGLKALGLAPMPWRWPRRWLASSLAQHAVWAVVADRTYRALTPPHPQRAEPSDGPEEVSP